MNRQNNKLVLSPLATIVAAIALIYTMLLYRNILFAVIGTSLLFLITVFYLAQNLIVYSAERNKALNANIKSCVEELTSQIENMNNSQSQINKATYLYTRQAAQAIANLESNYTESQAALSKNISTLSNTQNKTAKLLLKCDQKNTIKVVSAIKDMRNNLNETMIQGFDQIQPNNEEMVVLLNEIVSYLRTQSDSMDQALGLQLNNVAHDIKEIAEEIVPEFIENAPIIENNEEVPIVEKTVEEQFAPTFTVVGKSDEEDLAAEPETIAPISDDPNKQLSPDEIAALFASLG